MELTQRQKLTIEHLKQQGIAEPLKIIEWCVLKLSQPKRLAYQGHPNAPKTPRRKHSKQHYQGIINYLAQQPTKQAENITEDVPV